MLLSSELNSLPGSNGHTKYRQEDGRNRNNRLSPVDLLASVKVRTKSFRIYIKVDLRVGIEAPKEA